MKVIKYLYKSLNKYQISSKQVEVIIQDLIDRYNEKNRIYHNLDHIENMFDVLLKYKTKIKNFESVLYACCFHDVIYDTKCNNNEEKSSKYAIVLLKKIGIDSDTINNTKNLILATKNHTLLNNNFDEKIFIDSDLTILGAKRSRYIKYMKAVRKEYSWVSLNDYSKSRIKVLKKLLNKKSIYYTYELYSKYEIKARYNLEYEIHHLE